MLRESLVPRVPVLAQLEVAGRVRRRQQLEHRQCDAPGVHLLEHLAHRFLARRLGQIDRRYKVLHERIDDCVLKPPPFIESIRLVARSRQQIRHLPVHRVAAVENDVQRKYFCRNFPVASAQVQINRPAEVAPNDPIRRDADDALLFAVHRRIDANVDARVVVPLRLVPAAIPRADRRAGLQGLKQRRQPLLAVEQQQLGRRCGRQRHAFEQSRLEVDVGIAGDERHDRADRIGVRNRNQQTADVVVVPHPAALEVRELQFSARCPIQQLRQGHLVAPELLLHRPSSISHSPDRTKVRRIREWADTRADQRSVSLRAALWPRKNPDGAGRSRSVSPPCPVRASLRVRDWG